MFSSSPSPKAYFWRFTLPSDIQRRKIRRFTHGLISGGMAAWLTQPFEVIKTIMLVNPSHNVLIEKSSGLRASLESTLFIYRHQNSGIRNFFRGGKIACVRQAVGFSLYSSLITEFNNLLKSSFSNKYIMYCLSAGISKILAVAITSPLILLKTRVELITETGNEKIMKSLKKIYFEEKIAGLFKGVNSVLSRELVYSVFHYSFYRYLQDALDSEKRQGIYLAIPPFLAGFFAIFASHPFEVIRNRIMIDQRLIDDDKKYKGVFHGIYKVIKVEGVNGLFKGFFLRMLRKPVNSGIVWSCYELLKQVDNRCLY